MANETLCGLGQWRPQLYFSRKILSHFLKFKVVTTFRS